MIISLQSNQQVLQFLHVKILKLLQFKEEKYFFAFWIKMFFRFLIFNSLSLCLVNNNICQINDFPLEELHGEDDQIRFKSFNPIYSLLL